MGSPKAPKPSKEEKAAQAAQAEALRTQNQILQRQYQEQQLLAPLLYRQNNVEPVYGPDGFGGEKLVGFKDLGPTEEEQAYSKLLGIQTRQAEFAEQLAPLELAQQGYDIERDASGKLTGLKLREGSIQDLQQKTTRQLLERQNQALAGTLPVDPALQREFDRSEQILESTLRKNLGEGYATSTPGIQAQAEQKSRREAAIFAAQHGEIGYAGQLASQAAQRGHLLSPYNTLQQAGQTADILSPFAAAGSPSARSAQLIGTIQAPYQGTGGFGTLAELYGNQASSLRQGNLSYNQPGKNKTAAALGGALSGAATGAAVGSVVPAIGTAIGALGGAVIGGSVGYLS